MLLLQVACNDSPAPKVSLPIQPEPIEGFWDSGNDTGVTFFRRDGTYLRGHRDIEAQWDGYEGRWERTDLKIYSHLLENPILPDGPPERIVVWRPQPPDYNEVREEEGHVYEFVATGEVPGSIKNQKFAYLASKDIITIDHGDYSSSMKRLPRERDD